MSLIGGFRVGLRKGTWAGPARFVSVAERLQEVEVAQLSEVERALFSFVFTGFGSGWGGVILAPARYLLGAWLGPCRWLEAESFLQRRRTLQGP